MMGAACKDKTYAILQWKFRTDANVNSTVSSSRIPPWIYYEIHIVTIHVCRICIVRHYNRRHGLTYINPISFKMYHITGYGIP